MARRARWISASTTRGCRRRIKAAKLVNGSANSSSDAQAPGLEGNIVITPGNRIPLTPSHIFKAHVDVQGGRDWTVGLAMTAVSSAYARGNENNQHQAGGPAYLGSGKSGGYAVVELNGKVPADAAAEHICPGE